MILIGPNAAGIVKTARMAEPPDPDRGQRLKAIKDYLQISGGELAGKLGVGYTTWQNYEAGYSLPAVSARRLKRLTPGLTLDWIYEAEADKMPADLQRALGALPMPDGGHPKGSGRSS